MAESNSSRWPRYARVPPFLPVPLRARADGWTGERQARFVGKLAETGCVSAAARAVGMSRLSAYRLRARPGATIRVDLPAQTVTGPDGAIYPFRIDAFRKKCLLEGLDDVGITLQHEAAIAAFETQYRKRFDWLFHGNV